MMVEGIFEVSGVRLLSHLGQGCDQLLFGTVQVAQFVDKEFL
jgi:hypothetical protein